MKERGLSSLPFEPILLDLLAKGRLVKAFQIVNGTVPGRIRAALNGEQVGTLIYRDD
ncbi:MAG: hypothetical protein P8077_02355 [Gammaproteobacteria bacterium]